MEKLKLIHVITQNLEDYKIPQTMVKRVKITDPHSVIGINCEGQVRDQIQCDGLEMQFDQKMLNTIKTTALKSKYPKLQECGLADRGIKDAIEIRIVYQSGHSLRITPPWDYHPDDGKTSNLDVIDAEQFGRYKIYWSKDHRLLSDALFYWSFN